MILFLKSEWWNGGATGKGGKHGGTAGWAIDDYCSGAGWREGRSYTLTALLAGIEGGVAARLHRRLEVRGADRLLAGAGIEGDGSRW